VANTSPLQLFRGFVLVDRDINRAGAAYDIRYSNGKSRGAVRVKSAQAHFWENDVCRSSGPAAMLPVELLPMEVQILSAPAQPRIAP
jgi:hypothetical protein